jgi:hypothetical protein
LLREVGAGLAPQIFPGDMVEALLGIGRERGVRKKGCAAGVDGEGVKRLFAELHLQLGKRIADRFLDSVGGRLVACAPGARSFRDGTPHERHAGRVGHRDRVWIFSFDRLYDGRS